MIGENIDYGNTDARDIIMHLLIDDGVKSRGHRENILNPMFLVVGSALGPHQKYRHACVSNFAGGVKAFDDIYVEDVKIVVQGEGPQSVVTPEITKCLNSVPGDTSSLLNDCQTELASGNEVTLDLMIGKKSIKIEFKDSAGCIRMTTISWHS